MALALRQQLRAAMAADVVEGAHPAVVVAHGEDRIAGERARHVVARRLQPLGPGEQHPVPGEDLLALALVERRVAVVAGRAGSSRSRGGWSWMSLDWSPMNQCESVSESSDPSPARGEGRRCRSPIGRYIGTLTSGSSGRACRACAGARPIRAAGRRRRRPSGRTAGRPSRRPPWAGSRAPGPSTGPRPAPRRRG